MGAAVVAGGGIVSALVQSIRTFAAEYSAEFDVSLREMIDEALLGTAILLTVFAASTLALVAFGK